MSRHRRQQLEARPPPPSAAETVLSLLGALTADEREVVRGALDLLAGS